MHAAKLIYTGVSFITTHACAKQTVDERKYIYKLYPHEIKVIGKFFTSEDTSFPLPDKKYSGKRFMKGSLAKSCRMYNLLAIQQERYVRVLFRSINQTLLNYKGKYY